MLAGLTEIGAMGSFEALAIVVVFVLAAVGRGHAGANPETIAGRRRDPMTGVFKAPLL